MQQWKTGEVAQLINVTKRTLQNWLEQEKIPRPQKGSNGYYVWYPVDVTAAQNYLQRLKSTTRYRIRGHDK
jgi:DNA-binding transcriptional MerR regulator